MEGGFDYYNIDNIGLSIRNVVKFDFENVINSIKKEFNELFIFYE